MLAVVAPLAGAWIEMSEIPSGTVVATVAPLAGAWIEMNPAASVRTSQVVAPLAGAWIEIRASRLPHSLQFRRSPRGSVD